MCNCCYPIVTLTLMLTVSFCRILNAEEEQLAKEEQTAEERPCDTDLARGYAQGSPQPLLNFLNDWHSKSKPVSSEMLKKKPAVERAVYDLYRAFFVPTKELYENSQYVVIQNAVKVVIVDSNLGDLFKLATAGCDGNLESMLHELPRISVLLCHDFRPQVTLDGKKRLLYLEPTYLAEMLSFLTGKHTYRGHDLIDRYWEEDCTTEDRKERLAYLNSAVTVFPGHWGTGWHFATHPAIRMVYFSSDLKRAVVLFRVHYGGGEAFMEREDNGNWKVTVMEETWAE